MLSSHLIHRSKNRSQVSLEPPQDQADKRSDSPLQSPGFPPQSAPSVSSQYDDEVEEEREDFNQNYNSPYRSEEARYYQLGQPAGSHPTRSQSTRSPGLINTNQPTIHLVGPHSSASTPSSTIDEDPDRYYQEQAPAPPVHKAESQKKKRGFFGLGSSSKDSGKNTPQKLGRSISVRRKEEPLPPIYSDRGNRGAQQQRWSRSETPLAGEEGDQEDSGAGLRSAQYTNNPGGPPIPDKDPLRSPAFPPPLTHQEYVQGKISQQGQNNSTRHPLDRQGSCQSSWEKTAQQINKHSRSESAQPTPSSYHPSPSSATSTSNHPLTQRAPHESLHQYYHEYSRPPSQQSLEPPPSQHSRTFEYTSKQGHTPVSPGGFAQSSMGPPPGQQPPPNRRSSESTQQSQSSQGREGSVYQPYNQSAQQGPPVSSNPSAPPPQYTAQLAPQAQNYRNNSQTSPMAQHGPREADGRSTPPPNRSRETLSGNVDLESLLLRHDELRMIMLSLWYSFCCLCC